VHPRTAASGVVDLLRQRILSGSLQPGMALPPERELASELHVSRSTLREGLSMLTQMGLLAIQPGRSGGAVVITPPVTTVSASIALLFQTRVVTAGQFAEFRRALEVEAAQLAAERRSERDLAQIAAALEAYARPGIGANEQNIHGRAFHQGVARASGNPLLAETMDSLNDAFAECFAMLHELPDPELLIHELHAPILEAIRRQDAPAARATMMAHFDQLATVLHELGLSEHPIGRRALTAPPSNEAVEPARRRRAPLGRR
jgi:DNA-binding FadR family transcriptional regulator